MLCAGCRGLCALFVGGARDDALYAALYAGGSGGHTLTYVLELLEVIRYVPYVLESCSE